MSKKSILIIDDLHPYFMDEMNQTTEYICDYQPNIERTAILEIISKYEGLVVRSKTPIDYELLHKAKNLRWIGRAGAGVENIDLEYAEKAGIKVIAVPEGNRDAVAEHAIALILALLNRIPQGNNEVKNWIWDREANRGVELSALKVGIIGFGNTGSKLAEKLRGFGCEIFAYDKNLKGFGNSSVKEVSLTELKYEVDLLSLHIPLEGGNKNLVDDNYLKEFRKNIYFFNLSRGGIVKTADLLKNIEEKKVLGAGLDVLENENFSNLSLTQKEIYEKLFRNPHVIFSPHVGGWSRESYYKISFFLVQKIKALIA